MQAIQTHFSSLSKRLASESARQQELEQAERAAKRARIKARREEEEQRAAAAAGHLSAAHTILDELVRDTM
jgi:hypothetical protein